MEWHTHESRFGLWLAVLPNGRALASLAQLPPKPPLSLEVTKIALLKLAMHRGCRLNSKLHVQEYPIPWK